MYHCDECKTELDLSNGEGKVLCHSCNNPDTPKKSMSSDEIQRRLFALVDEYAKRNLTEYYATDEKRPESLGQMMSTAFEWDGHAIMLAAAEGLEDSNFHDEAAELRAKVNI